MNKTVGNFISLAEGKYSEINSEYNAMKTNDAVTKATRNNRLYHFNRDKKTMRLIIELLKLLPDEAKLSTEAKEILITLTTLKTEREITRVTVKVGDKILDLMQKYADVKNLLDKINKAAESIKAHVDFTKGVIVAD